MQKQKYKIPGTIWLIFGIAISVFAQIVMNKQSNSAAMKLFFYIGLLFVTIGVFKILIKIISNPKTKKEKVTEQSQKTSQEQHKIVFCPKCSAKNYSSFNFCRNCGTKLR